MGKEFWLVIVRILAFANFLSELFVGKSVYYEERKRMEVCLLAVTKNEVWRLALRMKGSTWDWQARKPEKKIRRREDLKNQAGTVSKDWQGAAFRPFCQLRLP